MQQNRNLSLDLIKFIAMCGVIALHSTMQYINPNYFSAADVIYDLGIIAMPLFFMVSGYLLIGRENVTYSYAFRKIWGIIRFVAIITLTFSTLYCIKNGFSLTPFISNFCGAFVQKGAFSVFWYFGAIILCYLLLPLISRLFHSNARCYALTTLTLFVICSVVFSLTLLSPVLGGVLEFRVPATFRIWYILLYFFLGGWVSSLPKLSIHWGYLLGLFIAMMLFKEYIDGLIDCEFASVYYSSPIVVIFTVLFFIFVINKSIPSCRFISENSKLFLPVYTIHMFVIGLASRLVLGMVNSSVAALICWSLATISSLLIAWVLMKIPGMNKIFKI